MDNFGLEVFSTRKILRHYLLSVRFVFDFLSLLNFPTIFMPNMPLILNLLGLLKTLRFLRTQDLIRQSRMKKSEKALMSCGYFFFLLIIYLHVMGCLFFLVCLITYEGSTDRLDHLDELGFRYPCQQEEAQIGDGNGDNASEETSVHCYMFPF